MVISLRLPNMLGSPAQHVLTSPRGLMCSPRQGAAQKKLLIELFNGSLAGEVGKAEPQLEPFWRARLDVFFALDPALVRACDADVAAGQGRQRGSIWYASQVF